MAPTKLLLLLSIRDRVSPKRICQIAASPLALPHIKTDVIAAIDDLVYDPYPPTAEELRDHYQGIYKIKVDGWRIFYTVNEKDKTIFIVRIKRRTPDTYNSLFE